ncbi:TonB-dependent receptor [Flavisolibacter sp. BT320]|nr:TonB-dependent receptor [Flavisolibacter longurius]
MKITFLLAALVLLLTTATAQETGNISGSVVQNAQPAAGATVALLRAKDSATVKLSVANKQGQFNFETVADGAYLVSVTAVGHQKSYAKPFQVDAQQRHYQVPTITLVPLTSALTDVTVTAKRALIEQRIDRTILNVDASITNNGASALEVLEKSPGVSVDRDGNISLKGKEGVLVMIDGRPTQLGGADLANLLRGMTANQLDQVEIMTNPPARYDAAGTSGIINIKTKKITTAGYNGSANVTFSQGRYPKTAEAFNFNYRNAKVNLFTNLSHNYQKRFLDLNIDRNIYEGSTASIAHIFRQENRRIGVGHGYSAKAGIDFFATKKTTIGAVVNLNSRPMTSNSPTTTRIFSPFKQLESITSADLYNDVDWNSVNTNLNFRHLLDAKGKEITADIDYVTYGSTNDQFLVNSYRDAAGNAYRKSDTLLGHLPQDLAVYSARIDYLHPLKNGARWEAGFKSGFVRTDNNAIYDSIQYGRIVRDGNRSNHFVYEEAIHAAYVNLSTPLSKKLSAQLGLRLENTVATGSQKTTGETFDRKYTQLFPTVYFQYKASEKNSFGANFGSRVRRPGYQSLNPFVRLIDRYTYQVGNPYLKPSTSNNFELSHSWKNKITTTLNYTYVKDILSEITEQRGEEAYNMPGNVASQRQFGLSISANTPITKWWTSNLFINAYHEKQKGVINNAPLDLSATVIALNGTQQFKLSQTLTAELNGMYRNGGIHGVIQMESFGMIGAGLSKQILNNRGTIRLSARDIFRTQQPKGNSRYGNVDFRIEQVGETQVVSLGFTYNFSKGKKIAPVKRTAGSATEEQGRIEQ